MDLVKRFFKFVVPSIVSMWIFSLYTMVDGVFVSRGVGEVALRAVNLSMPFTSFIFMVGILLATGTSTVISIALGQGDLERARGYFNQNLAVTGVASLLLTVLVLLNLDTVARFLGATPDTLVYVKEYVGTIAVFAVFFTVSYNLEVQVKANGAPHISTVGVISCALMNVALDALFVLVFHWGVWGAAFATGLAQVTSTAVFTGYFLTHRRRLQFQPFRWELSAYRRILPLGLSEGLNELSNGLVIFLFNHVILRVIGENGLTPYTIISYVNTLVLMTMTGIAQGIQPLVSFHLGAKERSVCHRLLRYGITLALTLSVVFFFLVEIGDGAIVGFFLEHESPMFSYSISALGLYAFSFLPMGLNVVTAAFFTAVERPAFALSISFGRSLVLMAVSLLTLSALFGDTGIWLSTLCSELLCLLLTTACALAYRRGLKRCAESKPT